MAGNELYHIINATGKLIDEEYYFANIEKILEQNNIPAMPKKIWVGISVYLGNQKSASMDIEGAKFCYSVAYELTRDPSYYQKIEELNKKLN